MKKKIEISIKNFIDTCYTFFKIGAGDFAKNNFYNLVNNCWDGNKSDVDNLREIKSMFETNASINETMGNSEASKVIKAYMEGWLNKIS